MVRDALIECVLSLALSNSQLIERIKEKLHDTGLDFEGARCHYGPE